MEVKKWAVLFSILAGAFALLTWFNSGVHGSVGIGANFGTQASPFVLPIVKRDSLLNGLQLITLEQQGAGSVSTHLRINSGGLFDLAAKGGLADITAGMLLKGGGGLNARNVAETVEQAGLTVTITSGWDSTDIVTSGPPESLETIFDLLGKLVIAPSFDQKELDLLKAARTAALIKEGQDDSTAVRRKALETVFGLHPFGRPARGTPESIAQITRSDLVYFHNRFYIANNSELLVRGDASAEQVTRLARSKLGAWKKGERIPPTFKGPDSQASRRVLLLDRPDDQGARADIAQIGVSRRAQDYLAALVLVDVFNQQASNLTAVHSGTTVTSDLDARLLAGPLIVSIKSAPGDLAGDLEVVLDTMSRMQTSVPTPERVESAKAKVIASMAERLKTAAGTEEVILDIETYGLGRDYVIRFSERVNAITPADVQRAAQSYLKPQSVTIVIAGSAGRFESQLKKLGTVAVLK